VAGVEVRVHFNWQFRVGVNACADEPSLLAQCEDLQHSARFGYLLSFTRLAVHTGDVTTDDKPNANKQALDEIHRLRGEFLSEMVDVEERLNHLIMLYFELPAKHREDFTSWVLTTIKFADKVELVAKVTQASRPANTLKDIISAVKKLNNVRNDMAHGGVSLYIGPRQTIEEAIADRKWASTRRTRSGPKRELLDIEQMQQHLLAAQYSASLLFTVMDEMAKAPDRVIPNDIDWRVRRNDSLDERGVPTISDELHAYFTEQAATWPSRDSTPE
jgi:hypothetical protein